MSLNRTLAATSAALLSAFAFVFIARSADAMLPPLSGVAPPEMVQAIESGVLSNPDSPGGLPTSVSQSRWRIPIILVSYSDTPLQYKAADFNRLLFDTTGAVPTGSAYDYYRWVSGGRLALRGEVVATVRLPETRSFYGNRAGGLSARESPNNAYGLTWAALVLCQRSVNWSDYDLDHDGFVDMLWIVHAGIGGELSQDRDDMRSVTSRLTNGWLNGTFFITEDPVPGSPNQLIRMDRFTILPELSGFDPTSISEIGVYCHEFGHTIGLPDLYTVALFTGQIDMGPGCWSLMSSGAYGTDSHSPQFPAHMGAWPMQFLGWDHTFRPSRDTTVVLDPLETGGSILELWYQGESESEHFLVENRQRLSYDRNALSEGLIIYHVDDATLGQRLILNSINSGNTPGLRLVEADGNDDLMVSRNFGDSSDPFPGALDRTRFDEETRPNTRTFLGARSNIGLSEIVRVGNQMRFRARVEAVDWLPPLDGTLEGYHPVESHSLGRAEGVDDHGTAYWVTSETRTGRPQVYLRSGHGDWGAPFEVTRSPGSALDPTLAVLPGGDLAIVWTDDRSGKSELYYRSRIQGVWTAERKLVGMPGDCRAPAIASDARGGMSLAFQYSKDGDPQLRFMRFNYFSPFGQSVAVTTTYQRPGVPLVVAAGNGRSYVIWSERSTSPQRLWFARFNPDSGLSPGATLTPRPNVAQLDPSAVLDRQGYLHVVWQTSGPGASQIHYQRRMPWGPMPIDTMLDGKGTLLQNPSIAIDGAGGMHLVYESFATGTAEVRYLHSSPAMGSDASATRVSPMGAGSATHPMILPSLPDDITIAYTQYDQSGPRIVTRRRVKGSTGQLEVGHPPRHGVALRGGPNPVRAGQVLNLWLDGTPGADSRVCFVDVAGRRVAEAALVRVGGGWRAEIPASTTRGWPAGVVFARVPGVSRELRLVVMR